MHEALAYDVPLLVDRLVGEGIADSAAEARALFLEVKRYLVMVGSERRPWDMYSTRVDEAWHQFILFTPQYAAFCQQFFKRYLHHRPNGTAEADAAPPPAAIAGDDSVDRSFAHFRQRYRERFGTALPEVWFDRRCVTPQRSVRRRNADSLSLREAAGNAELVDAHGDVLFSINDVGREALAFIVQTRAFYVRELPGGLDDAEKAALVNALVEARVLRVDG